MIHEDESQSFEQDNLQQTGDETELASDPTAAAETDRYVELLDRRDALEAEFDKLHTEALTLEVPPEYATLIRERHYDQLAALMGLDQDIADPNLARLAAICKDILEREASYNLIADAMQAMRSKNAA